MQWNAWGSAESATTLPQPIKDLLGQVLGISGDPISAPAATEVQLSPSRLTSSDVAELEAIVGTVATADGDRLIRSGGKSTLDLLRRRQPHQDAPDAVVAPATSDQIAELLRWCADRSIAVVPFGGGTSVVGGLDPDAGGLRTVLSVDLRNFDQLVSIDPVSNQATLGAGVTGPRAEELLGAHGFSLGHFPQSFRFATIGGFAATRSSGQASAGYGRFDDMVTGMRVVTPAGILDLGGAPKTAAGPDLRQLFLGSEGTFGIITEVTLRVRAVPPVTLHEAWHFPDFITGAAALRAVAQQGGGPTVMRLSDEAETGVNLASPGKIGATDDTVSGGALAITTFEGTGPVAQARQELAAAVLSEAGGRSLGAPRGQAWEHGRFDAPYLRDALLAVGVGCETLETATTWNNLYALKDAVTTALTDAITTSGSPALVLCHISHTYPTGASLYFTVVYRCERDPIVQWQAAKAAASEAIVAGGGTITHHHAVGADHRPWVGAEIGDVGVRILRAVKDALDPTGILNPGKLIP
ncbi:FAD-binding oxidoreductase [Williamsia sp. 1135]|uniref:FAD-binding oxidoreductase n=1 Tax=Williamsia sp. 1135 TaxID=1889262 RepID=UPI000A0FFF21|nr:FAD-binding oxidoreductase [Williamsia sp. 1135]ORM34609.1 FAD-binding oxidoreductase [Williamsia sp. 1135]